MSQSIAANDLKTKGITAFNQAIAEDGELFISVHGKNKFVVLTLDQYNHFRECELEAALLESSNDIVSGKFSTCSIAEHLERIKNG